MGRAPKKRAEAVTERCDSQSPERKYDSTNRVKRDDKKKTGGIWIRWIFPVVLWAALIAVYETHRDVFTLTELLEYTPSDPVLAAVVILALFAVKSISIVMYSGILYALNGVLFPLPTAVLLNLLGTAIMVTIPYFIGKKAGAGVVERIMAKYPRAARLKEIQQKNDFIMAFLLRLMGFLPADMISLYMGAMGAGYGRYLLGCMLGMLPQSITFPVMGMHLGNVRSPAFIAAISVEGVILAISVILGRSCRKRHGTGRAEKR